MENGRTSTDRYSLALRSTEEQIIPPPLNQRVRGSSPWRRTTRTCGFFENRPRSILACAASCILVRPSVGDGSDHSRSRLSGRWNTCLGQWCVINGAMKPPETTPLYTAPGPQEQRSNRGCLIVTPFLFLMLRDVGIQILTPIPSPTRRQLDAPRSDATGSTAVQRSSTDTQLTNELPPPGYILLKGLGCWADVV